MLLIREVYRTLDALDRWDFNKLSPVQVRYLLTEMKSLFTRDNKKPNQFALKSWSSSSTDSNSKVWWFELPLNCSYNAIWMGHSFLKAESYRWKLLISAPWISIIPNSSNCMEFVISHWTLKMLFPYVSKDVLVHLKLFKHVVNLKRSY